MDQPGVRLFWILAIKFAAKTPGIPGEIMRASQQSQGEATLSDREVDANNLVNYGLWLWARY